MEKLKALRNKSRGFCEEKKKHDSPTAEAFNVGGSNSHYLDYILKNF